MASGMIRVRVGASLDRSVEATFGAIERRAQRVGQTVQRAMQAGTGRGGAYRAAPIEKEYQRVAVAAERAGRKQVTAAEASVRDQMRAWSKFGRFMESELNRQARATRAAAAEQTRIRQRQNERIAYSMAYRAPNMLFGAVGSTFGHARRFAGDMLRGAGVDTSLGGAVGRGRELERSGIALSNQGLNPADARNAKRVESSTLITESRDVANKYGMDPAEILKAHDAFVSITGDLATSREGMAELAKLSAATGTSVVDMAQAQASVSLALGDVEGKAGKIESIMRAIAGQGKVGAVEIKDLAKGMAGIAAQAPMFTGDVGKNIETLGVLAQISRATGGSKSAAQAVTSVERFTSTLQTPARLAQFKAVGVNVYGKDNKIRDPLQLIKESLVATNADPVKMQKLFMNVMGARGVRGLQNAYTTAGGGKAGLDAIDREFNKIAKAAMTRAQVEENAAKVADSNVAKAQRFQNNLDKIAQTMASNLLPAMEKLAPQVLMLAEKFAGVVKWATDNPGQAITLAIVGSIARAGLGIAVSAAIEKVVLRILNGRGGGIPVPGGTPVPGGAPGGTPAGAGGLGIVPAAALAVGGVMLATDQASKLAKETGSKFSAASMLPGFNAQGNFSADSLIEDFTPGLAFKGMKRRGQALGGFAKDVWNSDANMNAAAKREALERARSGGKTAVPSAPEVGAAVANAMAGRTQAVRVTNAADFDKAAVDPSGRDKPPGGKK